MQSATPLRRATFAAALFALLFALAPSALAQTASSNAFHLTKISVSGQQHFTDAAVAAASGLSTGQTVTLEDVSGAAARLARYGAFDNVNFHYQTQGNNLEVIFEVVESKQMLPCRFDNFVWLSPEDLDAALRQRVPLYSGSAPPSGAMLQSIQDVLQAILKEKGVAGTVTSIPYSPAPDQPISAIRFDVTGVSLPIEQVSFPGASAVPEDTLQKEAAKLLGQNYSITDVSVFAQATLIPIYGEHGYLRARFEEPVGRLVAGGSASDPKVAVVIPVHEGVEYAWNGAVWSGNHVFTATDLNQMLGMRSAEVANTRKYEQGIKDVNDAYSRQGYIQMVISSEPDFDDAARRVTYRISVQEGPQFRMGSLEIIGLPPDATKRLLKSWKLQTGEVFDQAYVKSFVNPDLLKKLHYNPPKPAVVSTKEQPDPSDNKVDIKIGVQ